MVLPEKGPLFGQPLVSFPKRNPPGDDLAEIPKYVTIQGHASPGGEPAFGLSSLFDQEGFVQRRLAAANLDPQLQVGLVHVAGLPLDIKTQPAAQFGMLAQVFLVGVTLVKTGRYRVPALPVQGGDLPRVDPDELPMTTLFCGGGKTALLHDETCFIVPHDMIRIGIVGCGRILAAHLRGYRLLREAGVDDFRITALCARRADDARMYVRRGAGPPQRPPVSNIPGDPLGVAPEYLSDFQPETEVAIYTDYRQMMAEGPIDAVNDFTVHSLHHQIAAEAFAQGKDVLSQKPLAITVDAARRMCEEAEARNLVLGVFENMRNKPPTRQLKWLFESGRAGRLQMILVGIIGAWWAPNRIVAETPWRHRKAEAGGISLDMGVHLFHLVRYLGGNIRNISGRTAVIEPERVTLDAQGREINRVPCDADDIFFADYETENGVAGNLCASWCGHGEATKLGQGQVFYGAQGRVTGNEVTLDGGACEHLASLYRRECDSAMHAKWFPLCLEDAFALNQYDWLEAVRQRREPETSGRVGLLDLAAAFAILESAHAGRRVDLAEVLNGELSGYQQPIRERFGLP